jgi:hypothetical protein
MSALHGELGLVPDLGRKRVPREFFNCLSPSRKPRAYTALKLLILFQERLSQAWPSLWASSPYGSPGRK